MHTLAGAAPRVGEHSRDVPAELGYSAAEIDGMVAGKVVRVAAPEEDASAAIK
jgi:crotonobetainyl-CoA:carnitine CoA-transferase CaiB-like acyl-CoA transferase